MSTPRPFAKLLAPALVIVLAAAGCVQQAGDVAPTAGTLPELPGFGVPLAMDQPTGGAEPNMAIAPDGTIWITAVAGSQERPNHETGAAWLWRSTDGGATWETMRAPVRETPLGSVPGTRRPFSSSDADVVTSPDGWVYYTDWWNWGSPAALPLPLVGARQGSYLVERSADGGETWESTSITTLDTVGGMDRQWLVAGPDGFVGLFYAYFHGPNPARPTDATSFLQGKSSIQAVYSDDHGATWTEPAEVVSTDGSAFNQIAHPDLTEGGLLWMPLAYTAVEDDYWNDPSEVRVALSQDMGASWEVVTVAQVPEGFESLWAVQGDAAPDGTLHVAWGARTGETMTLFHAASGDGGMTWTEPHALRAEGLNFLPWVAAGNASVAISWYGSDATGDPTEVPDETEWAYFVARSGPEGWNVTMASAEPVKTGPLCPKGASCSGNRELLDYGSVAFAPDGRLHAAFATSRELSGGVKAGLVNHVAEVAAQG